MEENRQIMRALATAMNRIDQMYCCLLYTSDAADE